MKEDIDILIELMTKFLEYKTAQKRVSHARVKVNNVPCEQKSSNVTPGVFTLILNGEE